MEIKPLSSEEKELKAVEKVLDMIQQKVLASQCDFISFSLFRCKEIKRKSPLSKVQYFGGNLSPKEVKKQGLDSIDYNYKKFKRNPHWIRQARMLGLSTNAWTVNDKKDAEWLMWLEIDYITTNYPNEFKNLLQ